MSAALRPVSTSPLESEDHSAFFAWLRLKEYARLDRVNEAYLDFTGSALYADAQITAHSERMRRGVFGNPHSENGPSKLSTEIIEEARERVLAFLDAPRDEYVVCFTANTTAAIKIVAESYRFGPRAPLVLSADNHNSMNGLREFARRGGSGVRYINLDTELRLRDAEEVLDEMSGGRGLLGFPAQSNFSGVKHPLELVSIARSRGYSVLLDAAAYLPTNALSLSQCPADFVALSAYKILGYPTGVGALVVRKQSLARLERPWFAGGTVEYASVQHSRHLLRPGSEAFEDGTPAFLSIAAVCDGLEFIESVGYERIDSHVSGLTEYLLVGLQALRRADGSPLVELHGPADTRLRGGTLAFNVMQREGTTVPFAAVVDRAREAGVSLRGGCFCNPGAAEAAFQFPADAMATCLDRAGRNFSIDGLSECLGPEVPVGAVRASVGIATNEADIDRALEVISSFA